MSARKFLAKRPSAASPSAFAAPALPTRAQFRDSETVDFAIVGSGAAGGVMARELARAGLSVVVLEQGPRPDVGATEHDEMKYWYLAGLSNDAVKNPQTFRDDPAKKAELQKVRPPLWYYFVRTSALFRPEFAIRRMMSAI